MVVTKGHNVITLLVMTGALELGTPTTKVFTPVYALERALTAHHDIVSGSLE